MYFTQMAKEELGQQNLYPTTTATQFDSEMQVQNICRYSGNNDELNDRVYIFGRPRVDKHIFVM